MNLLCKREPEIYGSNSFEDYFKQYYSISINGKLLPLQFKTTEIMEAQNILIIKFSEKEFPIKKGDQIIVENRQLC